MVERVWKSTTAECDMHVGESNFQTRSGRVDKGDEFIQSGGMYENNRRRCGDQKA